MDHDIFDIFKEVRERVSAKDAARQYGIEIDQYGKAKCPFHDDRHPSMTFKNGRFRCWACDAFGDSIDFTERLLGLEPMAAVERLNADFSLALPFQKQPTAVEAQAAQKRQEILDTYRLFEKWRDSFINQLNACLLEGHLALRSMETLANLDQLTDAQALAIREYTFFEQWADTLTSGTMLEQMEVFRERRRIEQSCEMILHQRLPMKSGVV